MAHAPGRLHEEMSNDYNNMIYPKSKEEIAAKRRAFLREWRLKHRAVAEGVQTPPRRSSTRWRNAAKKRALGPVGIYREFITAATRWIMASKL